jgi:hypothetical protein
MNGNGKACIDMGLECKWPAGAASQQEVGRKWSGSQGYYCEEGTLVAASTGTSVPAVHSGSNH